MIGKAHWTGDAAGMDIEFEQHNVSFQVNGDVWVLSATVEVTENGYYGYCVDRGSGLIMRGV